MPEDLEDEVYTLSLRCSKGVISHVYYYELMDREPFISDLYRVQTNDSNKFWI